MTSYTHFFKCPHHGSVDVEDLDNFESEAVLELRCPICRTRLECVVEPWERDHDEKLRAFIWVSALVLLGALMVWAFGKLGARFDLSLWFSGM